jgi:glycosyltransferase involved in cell wall biosynthesis
MSADVFVSVIVPVYNAEKYLDRCLNSILGQTLKEIEVLCVNDGSTDRSCEILNGYAAKDSRIHIFNQNNKGPGTARNTALTNVKGKYILFCDADDSLEPNACYECYTAMKNNEVDIVVFNSNIIEVDRISINNKNFSGEYIPLVQPNNKGRLNHMECIKISILGNVWGYLFSSDIINRYNLRFTRYYQAEDTIFLQSYLMIVRNGYAVEKYLYNYFAYKGSLADRAYSRTHPWLIRLSRLPGLMWNTFKFAAKSKKPLGIFYVFFWILYTLIKRSKR